tara:strand:+ start:505 stop:633 length:129 start_codon:yes stop_codon:yes gene_type:complete
MDAGSTVIGMSFLERNYSDRLFKGFRAGWHGHVAQLDKAVAS